MSGTETTSSSRDGTIDIALIAALDREFAIGRGNALPWHLPDDLARFKAATLGKPILMGRKTAESLGRALPKRPNLVLTRAGRAPFDGMQAVASLDDAVAIAKGDGATRLCVIGGAEIYALTLPVATSLSLTWVDTRVDGADAFFPRFDLGSWTETARVAHLPDERHAFGFTFVDYRRA